MVAATGITRRGGAVAAVPGCAGFSVVAGGRVGVCAVGCCNASKSKKAIVIQNLS
jgi:hypothetical protein